MVNKINFSSITLRSQITSRGGGIEIALGPIDQAYAGHRMTAYQNYLGGGLLGKINNSCTVENWRDDKKLLQVANDLSCYFHSLTNPDTEWESMSFEQNQNMPSSGY